jgi:Flp pilus assembly pilin Flp
MKLITRFIRDDQGQDLIEYALLAAFVSLAAIGGATFLGNGLQTWYNAIGGFIAGMPSSGPAAP